MMRTALELATSGSIVLKGMVEKKEYSYGQLSLFTEPQSPLPIGEKMVSKAVISSGERRKRGRSMDLPGTLSLD